MCYESANTHEMHPEKEIDPPKLLRTTEESFLKANANANANLPKPSLERH